MIQVRKDFLIPEGKRSFQIHRVPYAKVINDKYPGVVIPLKDLTSGAEYDKFFFPGSMDELISKLDIQVNDEGNADENSFVGKIFKCKVVHVANKKGKVQDSLTDIEQSAWDDTP